MFALRQEDNSAKSLTSPFNGTVQRKSLTYSIMLLVTYQNTVSTCRYYRIYRACSSYYCTRYAQFIKDVPVAIRHLKKIPVYSALPPYDVTHWDGNCWGKVYRMRVRYYFLFVFQFSNKGNYLRGELSSRCNLHFAIFA